MNIYIYPNKRDEFEKLREHCRELSFPDPILWRKGDTNLPIKDLLEYSAECPTDVDPGLCVSNLSEPVILFWGADKSVIREMIQTYKKQKEWPIFAIVTKQSLEMTLSCLIEHLLCDREEELRYKRGGIIH